MFQDLLKYKREEEGLLNKIAEKSKRRCHLNKNGYCSACGGGYECRPIINSIIRQCLFLVAYKTGYDACKFHNPNGFVDWIEVIKD